MRYLHVIVIQHVIENQIINMALVTGNQYKRTLVRHIFYFVENLMIGCDPVEHSAGNPGHNHRRDLYESRFIIGGDFFYEHICLAVNFLDGNFSVFRMGIHESLKTSGGQNTLPQLLPGFSNRSGDALAVPI